MRRFFCVLNTGVKSPFSKVAWFWFVETNLLDDRGEPVLGILAF